MNEHHSEILVRKFRDLHLRVSHHLQDRAMWNLIELFTNMDLAQLSALIDIQLIPSLDILPYDGRGSLTEASASLSNTAPHLSSLTYI
jgi:hypothetical protein